jgi:hypothetical protein
MIAITVISQTVLIKVGNIAKWTRESETIWRTLKMHLKNGLTETSKNSI